MEKKYLDFSLEEFAQDLGSKKSMPGGGSVAAYALNLANGLASMVANFTSGKKKYAAYQADIEKILEKCQAFHRESMDMVDRDAEAFLPLAAVYKMPSDTDEEMEAKYAQMQICLTRAASVPLDLLRLSKKVLDLHEDLLEKGSIMLLSDVGVGVAMLRSAALSARINVMINIKDIDDQTYVTRTNEEVEDLVADIVKRSDYIYDEVFRRLR
ncbi:Formiminotransferase-cyclodeaminase [Peptostreptococcus stomatis DSM 17678]|uniref:Formiminotransferase-cyclodeaminase n=1 Tax=Peptostreptococcus stomatis DSM 17678 TaxID=596315 RepID=E0E504_9FIRM|nr:cyclodeaminase/cyclohydrolase family protein [Peptostreptococcus stomatis]EFM64031.1 Formiminotransferase-cyclodeaminase [Peptostreptococcus stomatis DSM 17678]